MTTRESPIRLVMAGSYESYEPAITKRIGDSRGVMTNQALLGARHAFQDIYLIFEY